MFRNYLSNFLQPFSDPPRHDVLHMVDHIRVKVFIVAVTILLLGTNGLKLIDMDVVLMRGSSGG
jgi:hypothetical protein